MTTENLAEFIPPDLVRFERMLQAEVGAFKARAASGSETESALQETVGSLLREKGVDLSDASTFERLQRMLAAQQRWSRSRHPAYDLNRHILLDRTCKAVAAHQRRSKTDEAVNSLKSRPKMDRAAMAG